MGRWMVTARNQLRARDAEEEFRRGCYGGGRSARDVGGEARRNEAERRRRGSGLVPLPDPSDRRVTVTVMGRQRGEVIFVRTAGRELLLCRLAGRGQRAPDALRCGMHHFPPKTGTLSRGKSEKVAHFPYHRRILCTTKTDITATAAIR